MIISKNNKMFNISNILSLLRLVLTVPIIYFIIDDKIVIVMILGALAFLTDFFDGWFARKLNQETEIGKIIDPVADKILVGSVVVILYVLGRFPLWLGLAILIRDILILTGGLIINSKIKFVIPSNKLGKWTVLVISLYIFGIILKVDFIGKYAPYIVIIMVALSFISYIFVAIKAMRLARTV